MRSGLRRRAPTDFNHLLADVKMHDPGERAAVAQAYVKLVDCIATHREKRIVLEGSRRIQKAS